MKNRYKILIVIAITITSLLVSDQYYLSFQDKELKKSHWVQNCTFDKPDRIVPAIGLFNHTHSFDLRTCTWHPTEHGMPGFLESLYISFVEPLFIDIADSLEVKHAYAACAATILPQPCFDAFMGSHEPMTQKSIMENYAKNIESNYPNWQMSDRKWDSEDAPLQLPAIICTEFVADGMNQYRMAKWVDEFTISSFENHRNDWMCDKWLPPVDDGVKITWDKFGYLSNDVGIVKVSSKEMDLDSTKSDSFDIHVWSDMDHDGINLTVTETSPDSGVFEGTVFFVPAGESEDTTLLVEDAVYAEYKLSIKKTKIINESKDIILDALGVYDFKDREYPRNCWYQDNEGKFFPCPTEQHILNDTLPWYFLIVAYWPVIVIVAGITIVIVFIMWKKKRK